MTAEALDFVHRFAPGRPTGLPITLLLLHGTGGDETSLLPIAGEVAPGTTLLSPQGKAMADDQRRFFPHHGLEGVRGLDLEELIYRTGELARFVVAAAERYQFDIKRVVALGYSNGAAMTASLLLYQPGLLAGALIFRPLTPAAPPTLPDLHGLPVFVGGGRRDEVVPPEQAGTTADVLTAAGAQVTLRWENAAHKLTFAEMAAARAWLADRWPRE